MSKRIYLATLFVLIVSSINLYGQDEKKNAIKTNPLSLYLGIINFEYQHNYDSTHGFLFGSYFVALEINDVKVTGFVAAPEFRWYFSTNKRMNGWYLGPYSRYERYSLTTSKSIKVYDRNGFYLYDAKNEISASLTGIGGGASIGKQWVWGGFTLDAYIGLSFYTYNIALNDNGSKERFNLNNYRTGTGIGKTGISLGYAF